MRENTVKSKIKKAVSDLLEKKPYTDISITDVVKEANVVLLIILMKSSAQLLKI